MNKLYCLLCFDLFSILSFVLLLMRYIVYLYRTLPAHTDKTHRRHKWHVKYCWYVYLARFLARPWTAVPCPWAHVASAKVAIVGAIVFWCKTMLVFFQPLNTMSAFLIPCVSLCCGDVQILENNEPLWWACHCTIVEHDKECVGVLLGLQRSFYFWTCCFCMALFSAAQVRKEKDDWCLSICRARAAEIRSPFVDMPMYKSIESDFAIPKGTATSCHFCFGIALCWTYRTHRKKRPRAAAECSRATLSSIQILSWDCALSQTLCVLAMPVKMIILAPIVYRGRRLPGKWAAVSFGYELVGQT